MLSNLASQIVNFYAQNYSFTHEQLKMLLAQNMHETANFTSPVCLQNNNTGGLIYFKGIKNATPGILQPSADGGVAYAHFFDFSDSSITFIATVKKSILAASDLKDYAIRLKNQGYYGALIDGYYKGMLYYYNLIDDADIPYDSTGNFNPAINALQNMASASDGTTKNVTKSTLQNVIDSINTNNKNIESDWADVAWGARLAADEDSDWIGLRQFILYLATTYYPQSLLPFVELIPTFVVSSVMNDAATNNALGQNNSDESLTNVEKEISNQLDFNFAQFENMAKKLNASAGVADLFNVDPFQEYLTTMETTTDAWKNLYQKRGLGYKIYGQLVLNPSVEAGGINKPGAIGFTHFEYESGSAATNNLDLITMKLLDVQGNKFTDISSPWSFLLNNRPGSIG